MNPRLSLAVENKNRASHRKNIINIYINIYINILYTYKTYMIFDNVLNDDAVDIQIL